MKSPLSSILATVAATSLLADAKAIECYAITSAPAVNHLLIFDSATPGTVTDKTIDGLGGYELVGLDMRITIQTLKPANPGVGTLWAIGTNGGNFRLYVINPSTTPATATQVGGPLTTISSTVGNNAWGFAFNPGTDRFQLVGVNFNYTIDPNTADVVSAPDVRTAGSLNPAFSSASFTTNSFGISSQFYIVNVGENHNLCTSANIANGGLISEAGAANWGGAGSFGQPDGLAISDDLTFLGAADGNFYMVTRATGVASLVGALPAATQVRSVVIRPASFPPILRVTVKIKGAKSVSTTLATRIIKGTAACKAGIKVVRYKIGHGKFKIAKGTLRWKFTAKLKTGLNKITVRATGGNDVVSRPAVVKIRRVLGAG
ncbi:MAG: DUF4394 domain-containing protein [Chthoniobacterales bacterium]